MFKKVILGVLIGVLFIGQYSFVSNASEVHTYPGHEFYVNYAEPPTGITQGYLHVLQRANSGIYSVNTYYWNAIGTKDGVTSPVMLDIRLNSSGVEFGMWSTSSISSAYYTLYEINSDGNFRYKYGSGSAAWSTTFSGTAVAWKVYGNARMTSSFTSNENFTVYYSDDGASQLLMEIIGLLNNSQIADDYIMDTIYKIYTNVDDVEKKLAEVITVLRSYQNEFEAIINELQIIYDKADAILSEEKKQTSWLEKIFNFLQEKDEKEKQELNTQGSSSTSQGQNAIDDKGGDFSGALTGLTNSLSYSGTECAWQFPQVKIPSIPGVIDEVVLIEEQPIDFSKWVNAIPSNILLVVQSICTIGLIVYCFKELYDTIEYVLTLRGSKNE